MKLKIAFNATLFNDYQSPTISLIEAASIPDKQCVHSSTLEITPRTNTESITDIYGNTARRLMMPQGSSEVSYSAVVTVNNQTDVTRSTADCDMMTAAPELIHFTNPSRYCPSDRMATLARDMFGASAPGRGRIEDICHWINAHIAYQYGTSNSSTMADDTLLDRTGVCRDFSHLAITLCRGLGIPARYVSGYCLGLDVQDLHAYFQVYLDDQWVSFDATSPSPRPALIQIATGRDAADCAWWTVFGNCFTTNMNVGVEECL